MPNCINCSAPLPPDSSICDYCGTRNEIDLKGLNYTVNDPQTDRRCPRCKIPLKTIEIDTGTKFLVEQCEDCFGLFFDIGELESIFKAATDHVYQINRKRLQGLIDSNPSRQYSVTYVPCPVCGSLMNRINYGRRSGVMVDICSTHGVWLDGGELRQLMEWVKAGGQLLTEQHKIQAQKEEKRRKDQAIYTRMNPGSFASSSSSVPPVLDLVDIVDSIIRHVGNLIPDRKP